MDIAGQHCTGLTWRLEQPWLTLDLHHPRRILSFAPCNPGFVTARHVLWRQVRDADLSPGLDASDWLSAQMVARGMGDAVGMMTSRGLENLRHAVCGMASCVATVGLGNAERVGHRRFAPTAYGTINIALLLEDGLTEAAMIEALTIVAEARTAAVIAANLQLPAGAATGTGTDCIAVACHAGKGRYAGLHTEIGASIGRAVYDAVLSGAQDWIAVHGNQPPKSFPSSEQDIDDLCRPVSK